MNARRVVREAAWDMSKSVVRIFAPLLRDEELVDAHREVFDELAPALEALVDRIDRDRRRLRGEAPTDNGDDRTA